MIVYIAGPYAQPDQAANVRLAIQAAEIVRDRGHLPYVPHLMHLWHLCSPHSDDYWLKMGLEWVRVCDVLYRIPGYSAGADAEEELARALRKVVVHTLRDLRELLG